MLNRLFGVASCSPIDQPSSCRDSSNPLSSGGITYASDAANTALLECHGINNTGTLLCFDSKSHNRSFPTCKEPLDILNCGGILNAIGRLGIYGGTTFYHMDYPFNSFGRSVCLRLVCPIYICCFCNTVWTSTHLASMAPIECRNIAKATVSFILATLSYGLF